MEIKYEEYKKLYSSKLRVHGSKLSTLWPAYVKLISPKNLNSEEKLLLMTLLSYRGTGSIRISNDRLAENCSVSKSTLKRKMNSLCIKKIVSRHKVEGSRTYETIINEDLIVDIIRKDSPKDYQNIFEYKKPPGFKPMEHVSDLEIQVGDLPF